MAMTLMEHQKKLFDETKDRNLVAYFVDMGGGKTFINFKGKLLQENFSTVSVDGFAVLKLLAKKKASGDALSAEEWLIFLRMRKVRVKNEL